MFDGHYTLWGGEHSLFTRKLEAMLKYMRLDHTFALKNETTGPAIEARIGTHFIPALETPEGWMIHDTTPIGALLNAKYPGRQIIPDTPVQKIACHLLEDWADEWFGRYAVHTRWCYPDNIAAIGRGVLANQLGKFGANSLTEEEAAQGQAVGEMMRDQFGLRACKNRGCGPDQKDGMQADFARFLKLTSAHFSEHPFLLGNRASLGDFTFAGLFQAHFKEDPVPRAMLMEKAPEVDAMMDKIYHAQSGDETYLADDALPGTLTPIFAYIKEGHHRFLDVSRQALAAGEKWCEVDFGYGSAPMRSLKYSEVSRCHIREEILALSAEDRAAVDAVLGPLGVLDVYLLDPVL